MPNEYFSAGFRRCFKRRNPCEVLPEVIQNIAVFKGFYAYGRHFFINLYRRAVASGYLGRILQNFLFRIDEFYLFFIDSRVVNFAVVKVGFFYLSAAPDKPALVRADYLEAPVVVDKAHFGKQSLPFCVNSVKPRPYEGADSPASRHRDRKRVVFLYKIRYVVNAIL